MSNAQISATFVSIWDQGTRIESPCLIDLATGAIDAMVVENGEEDSVTTLDSQIVEVLGYSFPVSETECGAPCLSAKILHMVNQTSSFPRVLKELPSYVDFDSFIRLSGQPGINTRISYQYRDGANYKEHGEIITQGEISAEQVKLLEESLLRDEGGDDFLPRQVGMAYLCPLVDDDKYDDEIDHPVHTIIGLALTEAPAEAQHGATVDLINRFAQAHSDGWDMVNFGND